MKVQVITRDESRPGFAVAAEFEAQSWAFKDGVVNIYSEESLVATYARETVLLVKKAD
jgi:hypothetical protein